MMDDQFEHFVVSCLFLLCMTHDNKVIKFGFFFLFFIFLIQRYI